MIDQALDAALNAQRAGRLAEAEGIYRQILAQVPNHPDALHLLGLIALQSGKIEPGVDLIRRAIAANPGISAFHSNLTVALVEAGRFEEALASCQTALRLQPDNIHMLNQLGILLYRFERFDEAIAAWQQAVTIYPDFAEVHSNLGNVLRRVGRIDEAIAACHRAITIRPSYPDAHNNLGIALHECGRLADAESEFRAALAHNPQFVQAMSNLSILIKSSNRLDEAVDLCHRAIALSPQYASAHLNLGNCLKESGLVAEAVPCFERALSFQPDSLPAHSNILHTIHFDPAYDSRAILTAARQWNDHHAAPLKSLIQPHTNDRSPDRSLRVGYVCADFRDHCQSFFTRPLLASHDRRIFEIFCYSAVDKPDAVTAQIRAGEPNWRDISKLTDQQTADLVRADKIDILVDLTMHMAGSRLLVFARKPAPVQITWLAYPGTTGVAAIDYRLTDPYLDPPGEHDADYTEQSIRLPDTFWCFDPGAPDLMPNDLPAVNTGTITFGCLNNFSKVNDHVLNLWAKVLSAIPESQLLLMAPQGRTRDRVMQILPPDRVQFTNRLAHREYLELYHRIDIGLDTFPYNGHTTSLDSFWMGVPVVTLIGPTVVGRAGWSILNNLSLPDLAAQTPDQFVQIAVQLANDLPCLSELRRTLRQRVHTSPLMDAPLFARNMETAHRAVWQSWCAQTP